MLRALFKKQLMELTSFLYQNKKDGKRYSKVKVILLSLVMLLCFAGCSMAFVGMSLLFADALLNVGADWLFMSMAGITTLFFGIFGSVLTTYNTLYHAKDNDLLLCLPIPAGRILLARMLTVYLTSLLFTAMSWIPAVIVYAVTVHPGVSVILADLAMMFVINLAAVALGSILGWLVALVVSRVHNKYVGVAALLIFLFGFYYLIYFRMNEMLQEILQRMDLFRELFETKLYPIYEIGLGATGDAAAWLIVAGMTLVLFAAVYFVLSRTFFRIVSMKQDDRKKVYVEKETRQANVANALFRKEIRRWTGSMAYLINTGIGLLLMTVVAVLLWIKRDAIFAVVNQVAPLAPWLIPMMPFFAVLLLCLLNSMNMISAPSVSLEGKMLWILRTAPVESKDILIAKQKLHMVLCVPPVLLATLVLILLLKPGVTVSLLMILTGLLSVLLNSAAGLALNLKMPSLDWTNETVPVKSGAPTVIVMFGGWGLCLAFGTAGYFLRNTFNTEILMLFMIVILLAATTIINRWIFTRGVRCWEDLKA